jgi:hypothetical protein
MPAACWDAIVRGLAMVPARMSASIATSMPWLRSIPAGIGPIPWIDGCRSRRVLQLLGVLWLLAVSDLLFTIWAHHYTAFHEANPLARMFLDHDLLAGLVMMKLGLTGLGAAIFWRLRCYGRAELALWAVVGLYVLLAVRWADYTSSVILLDAAIF